MLENAVKERKARAAARAKKEPSEVETLVDHVTPSGFDDTTYARES